MPKREKTTSNRKGYKETILNVSPTTYTLIIRITSDYTIRCKVPNNLISSKRREMLRRFHNASNINEDTDFSALDHLFSSSRHTSRSIWERFICGNDEGLSQNTTNAYIISSK